MTKRGSGRTTAALVLASVLVDEGASVVIIDADANQPLAQWAADAQLPETLTVIGDVDEENILETIAEQAAHKQFVIVELEGSPNLATSYAMSLSNLIFIPIQASHLDASEAAKTLKLVDRQRKTLRGQLHCMVFWPRANAAIQTSSAKDIQNQFAEALSSERRSGPCSFSARP
ncbi:ParA family protein [Jiella mangrovi]|uniref:ParA family protein n=1 Tax=Jiella mangrovi TaxID=2821407 RepID=A0ABS4BM39_9HYPH|nr:ParA family protein [Jiella mangrovi]MBP0617793.1 ParA family protein [Jiella mangrovi]